MVPTQRELYWKLGFGIQAVGCGSYCPMNIEYRLKADLQDRFTQVHRVRARSSRKQSSGKTQTSGWQRDDDMGKLCHTNQPPRGFWVKSLQLKFMPTASILTQKMRYRQFSSVLLITQVATETKTNQEKKLDTTQKNRIIRI
jgi:hypothetical protein